MALSLPQIKLTLTPQTSATDACGLVQQVQGVSLLDLLNKNTRAMWPYLIYGYQCEYVEPSFVPQVFSPAVHGIASPERSAPAPAQAPANSPAGRGVQVLFSQQVRSEFKSARKDDPLFKEFFDDVARGKNRAFVAARLKAATGRDASFLDSPEAPPE